MILIPCAKPYLIKVEETGQIGSKIELFIWNDGTEPTNPTYTFTKDAPSLTDLANYYNVSPFISEFIDLENLETYSNSEISPTSYANVRIKRYKNIAGTYTLLDSIKYISTYGIEWGDEDRIGFLDNKNGIKTNYNDLGQTVVLTNSNFRTIRARNYDTNEILWETAFLADKLIGLIADDISINIKFELIGFGGVTDFRIFIPQTDCLYTPVNVFYTNSFGIIETTAFYKANKQEFSIENSEFKAFQTPAFKFPYGKQRQTFNTIGREKISVNSGWVDENYKGVIKDIMMSESTFIYQESIINDATPVNIETKNILIQSNINNDLINYQLTFNYSNDYSR